MNHLGNLARALFGAFVVFAICGTTLLVLAAVLGADGQGRVNGYLMLAGALAGAVAFPVRLACEYRRG